MNSLIVVGVTAVAFILGYRFYARKIERLWGVTDAPTPATAKYDGVDYVPAKNWLVLFGHHFASIAGAGPIIGPVLALMFWGWLPALIWIIAGTIFIGGVHDFGSLMTSVREGGSSVADIAEHVISCRAKVVFVLFVWFALILIIAVFAYLCADTFVKEPKIVLPSLGLIPIAMLVGYLMYYRKTNNILTTVFGIVAMVCMFLVGSRLSVGGSLVGWTVLLLVYAYGASILPVTILLQPRDYLSCFLLFFGMAAGYAGLVIAHPVITAPAYVKWTAGAGALWPMLFITVACGAVSGFHALISSGTSSKQIPHERDAKKIGYGAMVAEGFLAVLALLVVAAGTVTKGNISSVALAKVQPIELFGRGYGAVTKGILGGFGAIIAMTILNAFILTTLDTATRVARYLTEELFNVKNRFVSTAIVVICGGILAVSGKWMKIWPVFGAANQLVAALALLTITGWLLARNKPVHFTFAPMVFMVITTIAALVMQIIRYARDKDYMLFIISLILAFLAVYMLWESAGVFLNRASRKSFRT